MSLDKIKKISCGGFKIDGETIKEENGILKAIGSGGSALIVNGSVSYETLAAMSLDGDFVPIVLDKTYEEISSAGENAIIKLAVTQQDEVFIYQYFAPVAKMLDGDSDFLAFGTIVGVDLTLDLDFDIIVLVTSDGSMLNAVESGRNRENSDTLVVTATVDTSGESTTVSVDKTVAEVRNAIENGYNIIFRAAYASAPDLFYFGSYIRDDGMGSYYFYIKNATGYDSAPSIVCGIVNNSDDWQISYDTICTDFSFALGFKNTQTPYGKTIVFDGSPNWQTIEIGWSLGSSLDDLLTAAVSEASLSGNRVTYTSELPDDGTIFDIAKDIYQTAILSSRGSMIFLDTLTLLNHYAIRVLSVGGDYDDASQDGDIIVECSLIINTDKNGEPLSDYKYYKGEFIFEAIGDEQNNTYRAFATVTCEPITATVVPSS